MGNKVEKIRVLVENATKDDWENGCHLSASYNIVRDDVPYLLSRLAAAERYIELEGTSASHDAYREWAAICEAE